MPVLHEFRGSTWWLPLRPLTPEVPNAKQPVTRTSASALSMHRSYIQVLEGGYSGVHRRRRLHDLR